MDPSDLDGEDGALSFNELPPSVRARMQAPAPVPVPQQQPAQPQYTPQAPQAYMPQQPRQMMVPQPPAYAAYGAPVPVGQNQGAIYKVARDVPASDSTPWLFVLATVVLGGVGWWAYKKMEKDRKFRVGPPRRAYGDDDGDAGEDVGDDDGEPGGPLDDYADAGLPDKDVDPHEDGGIKMVRG